MTILKMLIYKLLNILYIYIGNLILKMDVKVVFNLKFVESKIGNYYRVPDYTINKKRETRYVIARHVLRTVLRNNTNMSLQEIAAHTLSANHGNVLNSQKKIDNLIETDAIFKKKFFILMESLDLKYTKYSVKNNRIEMI